MTEFVIAGWVIILAGIGFKVLEAAVYGNTYCADNQDDVWVGDHFEW